MNTNFFLTIIIAVIIAAGFCYVGYTITRHVIIKFILAIKRVVEELDAEPDETSALVRYRQTEELEEEILKNDRAYNEMLMNELRKDALKAKTLKGKVVEFKIYDDPTKINSNDIIFMQ